MLTVWLWIGHYNHEQSTLHIDDLQAIAVWLLYGQQSAVLG